MDDTGAVTSLIGWVSIAFGAAAAALQYFNPSMHGFYMLSTILVGGGGFAVFLTSRLFKLLVKGCFRKNSLSTFIKRLQTK